MISEAFRQLQHEICIALEEADGSGKFKEDAWTRPGGGGGFSRVLTNGRIIEKGGVNFSQVWGRTPQPVLASMNLTGEAPDFFATGVSIVLHPENPHVPIIHMNVRYFEMSNGVKWFGGGIDLTPHYIVEADAREFHQTLRDVCAKHDSQYYPEFKKWADDYFYLSHRKETRGVGGIFFDTLRPDATHPVESRFAFVLDVGKTFAPIYTTLMLRHFQKPYTEAHKKWQHLRRGRYVEFNLIHDRGTKFGLETDGRTESILMSLPPMASWEYNFTPEVESEESKTQALLVKGIHWI